MGRVGGRTLLFYLCTTALAVALGLLAANLFPVGRELGYPLPAAREEAPSFSLADTLLGIVPTNPIQALAEGNMLQILFFALALGWASLTTGEKGAPMYALTERIMVLAPVAVFALIAPVVAAEGPRVLSSLLGVAVLVYGACLVQLLLVYGGAVGALARRSPRRFFREALPAVVFAFSSASSAGALPFSLEAAERLGVPAGVRSFVLPLGATLNMDGTAIYQGVCALFIANAYGIPLALPQQLTIILTCTLASVGTAGVPGAGAVMLGMVLQSVGLPVGGGNPEGVFLRVPHVLQPRGVHHKAHRDIELPPHQLRRHRHGDRAAPGHLALGAAHPDGDGLRPIFAHRRPGGRIVGEVIISQPSRQLPHWGHGAPRCAAQGHIGQGEIFPVQSHIGGKLAEACGAEPQNVIHPHTSYHRAAP